MGQPVPGAGGSVSPLVPASDGPPAGDIAARQVGTLVSLLRIWTRARDQQSNPLPGMSAALAGQDTSPELAPACHSLFELTEACIGRRLVSGIAAAEDLSSDEFALLALVEAAPGAGTLMAEARLPHGLPGALQWAASAVQRAIGGPLNIPLECSKCPFGRSA